MARPLIVDLSWGLVYSALVLKIVLNLPPSYSLNTTVFYVIVSVTTSVCLLIHQFSINTPAFLLKHYQVFMENDNKLKFQVNLQIIGT